MKVLFVATECAPYAKAGGLGDVVGALPKALVAAGHDARVLLPRYGHLDTTGFTPLPGVIGVPLGFGTAWCALHEGRLPQSSVPVYLLEHDAAFGPPRIYGGESGTIWGGVRFGILSRAAFELGRYLNWIPDVMHVHDWPTAWVPLMANGVESAPPYDRLATVLTIHNMAHQPRFPLELLDHLGLGRGEFRADSLEDFGEVNVFKGGLYHSTKLTTVSPRYVQEIRSPAGGFGLDHVLEFRGGDLVGILNGIDEQVWDPATDPLIPATFDADDLSGKAACKAALQAEVGLDPDPTNPLLGVVSRLTGQKGLDVIADALERLLATGAQLVLLGAGEDSLEGRFRWLASRHGGRFAVRIGYDEGLAHRIEAGADLFLMPSRFEPCGLNQLYSQRYGTLPVVHATGGLEDTVEQCDPRARTGTGFKMYRLDPDALFNTTKWAIDVFRGDKELFSAMQRQSMQKKMGWDTAADRYLDVYRWAAAARGVALNS